MNTDRNFKPIPLDILFGSIEPGSQEHNSEFVLQTTVSPQSEPQKRRKSVASKSAKRAKMTFDDDNITDENAKEAAKDLMDQIENTPGRIALSQTSSKTAEVCPIPPTLNQKVDSEWTIDQIQEGQLSCLLAPTEKNFKPLELTKLQKVDVETELLPRQMSLKDAINQLKQSDTSDGQYVGFAVAVANVLRRCDSETAGKLVQSITSAVEIEASDILNKQ